ncbi:Rmf/CrpP fold protein [Streptomyces albofaciens]|uniref:Rmf/CrpP fold protein n=1 Tax=Streptomyces albofaciens TaxID=66866 RepID=UPI00142EA1C7|nr:Rmf/CrpP fold protein [Streptomyces albofaciens]
MGTREQVIRAVTAGAEARRRGDRPSTCPYPRDSLLRSAWIRGYTRAAPPAPGREDDQ